jgi:succinyl-CoA synthetase alpha subunit
MAILVNSQSGILIQGITGREASMVTKHSLDYGTRIVAGVTPGKGGETVHGVPVFDTIKQARRTNPIDTAVIYVPPAFVYDAVLEAIDNEVKLVLIMTERVPVHDVAKLIAMARQRGVTVVGPNSVGIISPGERAKLGAIGGDNPARCFAPGTVGVISRSGGMTAECAWMVKRAGYGVSTAVSLGGDAMVGSTPKDLLKMFEQDKETKAVVMWGEPGTPYEEEVGDFIAKGGFTKPLVAFVAGRFVEDLPEGTVFGHAASIVQGKSGRPSTKIAALKAAGAYVPESFNDIESVLKQVVS